MGLRFDDFQCPGICPIASQVDMLVSDDSSALSPTMYYRLFMGRDQSHIRIKSVVGTVNMLKFSSISFTDSSKTVCFCRLLFNIILNINIKIM